MLLIVITNKNLRDVCTVPSLTSYLCFLFQKKRMRKGYDKQ